MKNLNEIIPIINDETRLQEFLQSRSNIMPYGVKNNNNLFMPVIDMQSVIDLLKGIVNDFNKGMKWVSVSDDLPPIDTDDAYNEENGISKEVMCFSKQFGLRFGRYYYNSGHWIVDGFISSKGIHNEFWCEIILPA